MATMTPVKKLFCGLFLALSFFIPGGALLLLRKPAYALCIPLLGVLWLIAISASRIVTSPLGFQILLGGLLLLHLGSYLTVNIRLWRTQPNNTPHLNIKHWLYFLLLILLNVLITVACHTQKAYWFGFELYHIPSPSMQPTLLKGDVILADTWVYQSSAPQTGNVIIIKRQANSLVLIKRLKHIRYKNNGSPEFFIVGDNIHHSSDSRRFGWVSNKNIIGQAQFVVFSFYDDQRNFIAIQ